MADETQDAQAPTPAEQEHAYRVLAAYTNFFTSENGRIVLNALRESLDGNTFRTDPYEAAYAAGRRSVYLNILQSIGQGEQVAAALQASANTKPGGALPARAQMPATIEEL